MATYDQLTLASQFLSAAQQGGLSPLPRVKARRAQKALVQAASSTEEELQKLRKREESDEDDLTSEEADEERRAFLEEDIEVDVPPVPEQLLEEVPDDIFERVARERVNVDAVKQIKEENGLDGPLESLVEEAAVQIADRIIGTVDDILFQNGRS